MLEKVPVTELRPDMYIHAFCARWIDHPLFVRASCCSARTS
jgi:hypothetical protein